MRRALCGRFHSGSSFSGFVTDGVIDRERKNSQNHTNHCRNRHQTAPPGRTSCSFERAVIDNFERSFVEVAVFVRIRIEEETLGAAFHCGTKLSGIGALKLERFLQDAPGLFEDRADL